MSDQNLSALQAKERRIAEQWLIEALNVAKTHGTTLSYIDGLSGSRQLSCEQAIEYILARTPKPIHGDVLSIDVTDTSASITIKVTNISDETMSATLVLSGSYPGNDPFPLGIGKNDVTLEPDENTDLVFLVSTKDLPRNLALRVVTGIDPDYNAVRFNVPDPPIEAEVNEG